MYDFIIIGGGLAGVTFANFLEKHGKSFCLIADRSQVASLIAGGVYNPVVLKRTTGSLLLTNLCFRVISALH